MLGNNLVDFYSETGKDFLPGQKSVERCFVADINEGKDGEFEYRIRKHYKKIWGRGGNV